MLLHGRGSSETDIIGLAGHLPPGPSYAAVRAPIGEGGGYAWFANRGIGRPVAESLAETMAWFRTRARRGRSGGSTRRPRRVQRWRRLCRRTRPHRSFAVRRCRDPLRHTALRGCRRARRGGPPHGPAGVRGPGRPGPRHPGRAAGPHSGPTCSAPRVPPHRRAATRAVTA
ncbi:hypothetical protein [Nocardioides sp. B-3]|uniref:hypothetical protein n=1 Tax=Nocardioides sp. B-3 TaxID=2895565 RepID=UPI0021521C8F|nr:hypothetical protein [Nocardioides sp. B-3]UUZ61230.1 hypothetical protein LP418_11880 [Nocardioides sp. B-3]